ncbi:hypothetical protein TraAM80_05934 [Trypanosoma rangeli]|uniref:SAM domain-containing protein n=1 Tax=Trypanosoma rangeli TaxID=5698 RepID=A0A3R7MCK0_TRYRA|nr:uncharacterized protein TraAM80_05934 [Trypanosoma rangeli]RNF03355.1 hypothetical protein TraAM80_05934 [Trypanosoma rangeli]|eukprot:RNF03355.1 hypothetical protein TraAM80_05934 [Trypanosoma rangeli]
MPHFAPRAIAVASAAAVTIPTAILLLRLARSRKRQQEPPFDDVPVPQWTVHQVAQWLRSLGVSEEAVNNFRKNDVDASVLFLLEEGDNVNKLAPKMRDQLLIRRGLRELQAQTTREEHEVKSVSAPGEGRYEAEADRVMDFLKRLTAIGSLLTSSEFNNASPDMQRRQRQECLEWMQGFLGEVQKFSPEHQAKLMPFAKKVETLIIHSQGSGATRASAEPSDLETQLKTLHEMVDSFLRVLDSTNMRVISDPQVVLLRERVQSQINDILAVTRRLPPQYGEPLRKKCELVLQKLQGGGSAEEETTTAVEATQAASASQAVLLAPMVKRLRDVFTSLKSSHLISLEPAERLFRISEMLKDVRNIQQEAATWSDPRAIEVVNQVSGNIVTVLEQMEALTQEEVASVRAGTTEEGDENGSAQTSLQGIVAMLQALIQVLYSDDLARAAPAVRQQMLSQLQQSMRRLRQQVAGLPLNQATASVAEMIEKGNAYVNALVESDRGANIELEENQGNEKEEVKNIPREVEVNREMPLYSSEVNPLDMEWQGSAIDDALLELEKLFEYINSNEYKTMPPGKKSEVARQNLARLIDIEKRCAQCEGFDQLKELIEPLKEIVQSAVRREEESAAPGRTPLFLNISTHLRQMGDLINSDEFKRADINSKKSAARSIIPQLQKIASTLSLLPSQERAAAERLLSPINETLKGIAAKREEDSSEDVAGPQHVMSQMEEVLSILQSEGFQTTTEHQRQVIVRRLLQKMTELKEECAQEGGAATPLLPILHRLTAQLQSFVQTGGPVRATGAQAHGETTADAVNEKDEDDGNDAGEDDDAQDEEAAEEVPVTNGVARREDIAEERQKLFKAVIDITSELRNSNNNHVVLSVEEVQPLLGLLEMVDSVGFITVQERRLRDEFDAQIRRASGESNRAGETNHLTLRELIRIFSLLKNRLSTSPPSSIEEMASAMTTAEDALREAGQQNIPWRRYPQVVNLIGDVLTLIQQIQSTMRENLPIAEGNTPNETAEEPREGFSESEDAVQTGANVASQTEDRKDNTPCDASGGSQDPQTAARDSSRVPYVNRQAEEEGAAETDENNIARLLLEISEQLREPSVPEGLLDRYSMLLSFIEGSSTEPSIHEAIASIREQINLQRISNCDTTSEEPNSAEENEEEVQEEEDEEEGEMRAESEEAMSGGSPTPTRDTEEVKAAEALKEPSSQEEALAAQSIDVEQAMGKQTGGTVSRDNTSGFLLSHLSRDCVPGGARNELLLLPRIEKRIFAEEQHFIEHTTLSDIQNVSKVILHLEKNTAVKGDPLLSDRVKRVKKAFARQLEAFHGSGQQSIAVCSSLQLCCRDTVMSGEDVREFVICTAAEADAFGGTINNKELVKSLTEGTPVQTTVPSEVVKEWAGRSIAVLFCEYGVMSGTELSELVLLREVLVNRYGFEVITVTESNATQMRSLLGELVSLGTRRLFLFCLTQYDTTPLPFTVIFQDSSFLPLREALQLSLAIERVVLLHCQPMKLTTVSALNGCCGKFLSVELTEAARDDVQARRCWLFDGLLTPALTELLSLDTKAMLCPEDLATYTVTALSSFKMNFGSFTEGEPLGMGFFVPCDAAD